MCTFYKLTRTYEGYEISNSTVNLRNDSENNYVEIMFEIHKLITAHNFKISNKLLEKNTQ
jgi:hypothetical protein